MQALIGIYQFDNSKFDGNTSGERGGALLFSRRSSSDQLAGNITINNSHFTNNQAPLSGGAIHDVAARELLITKSHFSDNSTNEGGAIYVADIAGVTGLPLETVRTVNIIDIHFKKNSAAKGGAILFDDPGDQSITLNIMDNNLNKNSATGLGGAYYQSGGISWVLDNHFNKNYDPNGDQVVVVLPATVNGQTTPTAIIASLVAENKKLDDAEISVI